MNTNTFLEVLDGICEPSKAGQRPPCPDSAFYSAAGRLIADHCQLDGAQKALLVEVLAILPGSPSAAAQALMRYRYPTENSRTGRTIQL